MLGGANALQHHSAVVLQDQNNIAREQMPSGESLEEKVARTREELNRQLLRNRELVQEAIEAMIKTSPIVAALSKTNGYASK
jgi:phage I-like protein